MKQEYVKDAETYNGDRDAFVMATMKGGGNPELLIGGDLLGIIHCLYCLMSRIGTVSNMSFTQVMAILLEMESVGYGKVKEDLKSDARKKKVIVSEDWLNAKTTSHQKAAVAAMLMAISNAALKAENEDLRKRMKGGNNGADTDD